MNTIVVVSEHQDYFTLFTANFAHLPVHFSWSRSMQDAMEEFPFEQPFILFAVSQNLEQLQNWVQAYDASVYQKPLVVFTGALDWTEREMLWKSGVSDIVELPRSKKELEFILRAFMIGTTPGTKNENEMQGRLQDLSVTDLIESFSGSKRSGTVLVENDLQKGQLEFYKGKLVNASLPQCDPLESVCVMSTWEEGVFFSRFDKEKHKERILLDNEQVLLECTNYRKSLKHFQKQLPDRTVLLYTDPDLAYEEFGPKDREILQQFRDGLSLEAFLRGYSGSVNFILKKIVLWINQKWLLTEDDYGLLQARIQAEARRSAIGKLFGKLFSGKQEKEDEKENIIFDVPGNEENENPEVHLSSLFRPEIDPALQKRIWEIPVILASEREEELFLQNLETTDLPFSPDIKLIKKETEDALILFYLLKNTLAKSSLKDFDPLLRKAPFVLILFESENAQVQSIATRLNLRYEIKMYYLSSQPIEKDGDIERLKNLSTIPVEQLILYDSLNDQKLTQVFRKALDVFAASAEAQSLTND